MTEAPSSKISKLRKAPALQNQRAEATGFVSFWDFPEFWASSLEVFTSDGLIGPERWNDFS